MIKKLNKILFLFALICAALTVGAFASGESSAEPGASGEPAVQETPMASGEPSAEPETEQALETFEVTINVNGEEYAVVNIGMGVEGNVYTFQIKELLDAVGINLTYDEDTDVAAMTAEPDSLMSVFMRQMESKNIGGEPSGEPGASAEPAAPPEPGASEEPAASGEPSGEPAAASEPATKEEFEAYTDYLRRYMTDYTGTGDGTFDEGARTMALGELDSVAFGANVNAFPFEMYITQFGAKDYASFAAGG